MSGKGGVKSRTPSYLSCISWKKKKERQELGHIYSIRGEDRINLLHAAGSFTNFPSLSN